MCTPENKELVWVSVAINSNGVASLIMQALCCTLLLRQRYHTCRSSSPNHSEAVGGMITFRF